MARPTDADLLPGLIAKDEAAVADLLDRYWERAYRVAFQLTRDPGAAEDVAQETFVHVLKQVGDLRDPEAFRSWFFGILRNTAKTKRRGETRRKTREQRAAKRELTRDRDVTRSETNALVREHLQQLPSAYRSTLTLRFLGGLSLAEVARVLDCPEGTVSSRIRRGLKSLKQSLEPSVQLSVSAGVPWLIAAFAEQAPAAPTALEVVTAAEGAGPAVVPSAPVPSALLAQGARATSRRTAWLVGLVALALLGVGGAVVVADPWGDTEQVGLQDDTLRPGAQPAAPGGEAEQPQAPANGKHTAGSSTDSGASDPAAAGSASALHGTLQATQLRDAWVTAVTPERVAALRKAQSLTESEAGLLAALGRASGSWNVPAGSQPVRADGGFDLELPPGQHWIASGAYGCPTTLQKVTFPRAEPLELNLEFSQPATLAVEFLGPDDKPLANTSVNVIRMSAPRLLRFPGIKDFDYMLAPVQTDEGGRLLLTIPGKECELALGLTQREAALDGNFVDHDQFPGVSFTVFRQRVGFAPGEETGLRVDNHYARFRLRVQDALGAPAPQAWVRLLPARSQLAKAPLGEVVGEELRGGCRETDAQGELHMGWIPPGNYVLVARDRLDGDRGGRAAFVVERAGELVDVELRLTQQPQLGTVDLSLRDARGEPASGRYRALLLDEGFPVRATKLRAKNGAASWTDLPAGNYELAVYRKRHAAFRCPVTIEAGGVSSIEVREPALASIAGTISGPKEALAGLSLLVNPTDARPGRRWTGPRFSTGVNEDGTFLLEHLPAEGNFDVVVRGDGCFTHTVRQVRAGSQDLRIELPATPLLELQVVYSDGTPAAEVPVVFQSTVESVLLGSGDTDAEGRVTLCGPLTESARLTIDGGNAQPFGPVTVDTQTTITIPVRQRVDVTGLVRDAAGVPLAGVRLVAQRENMNRLRDRKLGATDAQGRFTVTLYPGVSTIVVTHPGYATETLEWNVPEAGLEDLALDLSRGANVSGRLEGPGSARVQRLVAQGAGTPRGVFVLSDGGFDLGQLPAGLWTLEAHSASGAKLGSWSITVPEDGELATLSLSVDAQQGK